MFFILFMTLIVSLFTLFAELMVDKVQVGKLEENSRSCRNFKHVYSQLTDAAAVAVDTLYFLLWWLTQRTQP